VALATLFFAFQKLTQLTMDSDNDWDSCENDSKFSTNKDFLIF